MKNNHSILLIFIAKFLVTVCLSFLTGCFFEKAEAKLELNCVPKLKYILDKNYMYYSTFGTVEKPEIIEIIRQHGWVNSYTAVMNNRSGITLRKPVEKLTSNELLLLGPAISYSTNGPTPSKTLLYVEINDTKTWVSIAYFKGIAADQPYESNRKNNLQINVPVARTIENSQTWFAKDWQCPVSKR